MRVGRATALAAALLVPFEAQIRAQHVVEPTVRIGEGEEREFAFSRVTGLALDALGFLYVADGQEHRVDVFDAQGAHVASIGRRGNGPGEFQYPTSIGIAPDGAVWIRDSERLQRFERPAPRGPAVRFSKVIAPLPMMDWMSQRSGVVDREGFGHVPRTYGRRGEPAAYVQMVLRIDEDGRTRDSLVAPESESALAPFAVVRLSATGGRMIRGVGFVPFAAVRQWASTPRGTIISGDGREYLLVETDASGREVRRIVRPKTQRAIDPVERRDSLRALSARLDSIPVPLGQVEGLPDDVRAKRLPAHYPQFRELAVSAEGVLWVRRWSGPGESDRSLFDVFGETGEFVGAVHLAAPLAADPVLVVFGEHAAGVVRDSETGLESIVRFRLPSALRAETTVRGRP